ncbi:MAG: lipopolysaccharide heptosyltransferase I [Burkholderiales bacterium]
MRILLVKTSSMGDVIHNLPVVADICRHHPAAQIDWVVEESFADVPALHPGVRKVITVANRRWRKAWFRPQIAREFRGFKAQLQSQRYDCILDTQGLMKSALIVRMAHGRRCGYSASSAREPMSARFYDARFDVSKNLHAVERNRTLASLALGYALSNDTDYGLRAQPLVDGRRYAVLLHATSRSDKEWDASSWAALGQFLNAQEIEVLLPWGSQAERARSEQFKHQLGNAFVPERMPLTKLAGLLAGAEIIVGADTGLTHLAAALGRPTIGIYRGSDPKLTGLYGSKKAINLGTKGNPPSASLVIEAADSLL